MMKSTIAVFCAALTATLPILAHAQTTQYYPENTPQACSDRVDNDGDGYVDCYDPDCRYFNFCTPSQNADPNTAPPPSAPPPQQQVAPAPPPPAQPYYQPQPTTYTPTTTSSSSGNGLGKIIAGAIILPMGLGLAGGSAPLWIEGFAPGVRSDAQIGWLVGASMMAMVGTVAIIIGAVLIPQGVQDHMAWKRRQRRVQNGLPLFGGKVSLLPVGGATQDGGSGGFKLTF